MVVEVALVADEAEVAEDLVVGVAEAVEEDSVEEEDLEAAAEDSVAGEDVEAVDLVVAVVVADSAVVVDLFHPENPNKSSSPPSRLHHCRNSFIDHSPAAKRLRRGIAPSLYTQSNVLHPFLLSASLHLLQTSTHTHSIFLTRHFM